MKSGKLRVLHDDIVEANMDFGPHPHDNPLCQDCCRLEIFYI